MAYANVVHALSGTDFNGSTTPTRDSTGADLCVYGTADYAAFGAGTITDNKNTITSHLTVRTSTIMRSRQAYTKSPTVGSGHTASCNGAYGTIAFAAFSGAHLTAPLDQQNGGTTTGATSLSTGSITPSEDNCLIIAHLALDVFTGTITVDSGFTILDQIAYSPGFYFAGAFAYKIQTSAAAVAATFSWSGSVDAAASITSYKAAAAGGAAADAVAGWVLLNGGPALFRAGRRN
jgi:hypothetical protein